MNEQDRQLLLIDLCARLLYGVKIELTWWVMGEGTYINTTLELDHIEQLLNDEYGDTEIKPYLRPMSSMTKEEKEELRKEQIKDEQLFTDCIKNHPEMRGLIIPHFASEWCDKNMFDHRGLIPNGLALIAPKDMYRKEERK